MSKRICSDVSSATDGMGPLTLHQRNIEGSDYAKGYARAYFTAM